MSIKEKNRETYQKWYEKNKEAYRPKKAELMRKYRAANPEKYAAQSRKSKAKEREQLFELCDDSAS
jgi:hypothetical protein